MTFKDTPTWMIPSNQISEEAKKEIDQLSEIEFLKYCLKFVIKNADMTFPHDDYLEIKKYILSKL